MLAREMVCMTGIEAPRNLDLRKRSGYPQRCLSSGELGGAGWLAPLPTHHGYAILLAGKSRGRSLDQHAERDSLGSIASLRRMVQTHSEHVLMAHK